MALLTCAAGYAQVRLTGTRWSIQVDPATLAASAQFADGSDLPISLATPGLGSVTITLQEKTRASWNLPESGLHVDAALDRDRLAIQIFAARPGKFTWPVLGPDQRMTSVILPAGEGFTIPVDQKIWRDFATAGSPFQTMADLTMPLWALGYQSHSLTYILTNPMDNYLVFEDRQGRLALHLTHEFERNSPDRQYGLVIAPGGASPIEPALIFRDWLIETGQFVSMSEKLKRTPAATALPGAAHAYLWASGVMDLEDVVDWPGLLNALQQSADPRILRIRSLLPVAIRNALRTREPLSQYLKSALLEGLNEILQKRDLYQNGTWPPDLLPLPARTLAAKLPGALSDPEIVQLNGPLLNLAFPKLLAACSSFGGGISPKMIRRLQEAGFDRMWLGLSDLNVVRFLPGTVTAAKQAGFLIGPYDSYHSIHSPDAKQTWATAQFDRKLFEEGAIVQQNGTRDRGFQNAGSHLSSVAAEPYLKRRVGAWMQKFSFNSYFVDCDATGELFDNYSTRYPATKQLDMELRLQRLAWIIGTYGAVVGSEIGAYFAAPVIHFGHGMMTPAFGFSDPLLHDPKSPYYLGRWYPEGQPDVFLKQSVLPAKYKDIYFNEKYRIPLYQAAFHDSIVTTHHWSAPSLKFKNVLAVNELLEFLYGIPPLYHLTLEELKRREPELRKHQLFFSPNYRKLALQPLSGFAWLTPDREVQETQFGAEAVVVANFSTTAYSYNGHNVPPVSILLLWKKTGEALVYTSTL